MCADVKKLFDRLSGRLFFEKIYLLPRDILQRYQLAQKKAAIKITAVFLLGQHNHLLERHKAAAQQEVLIDIVFIRNALAHRKRFHRGDLSDACQWDSPILNKRFPYGVLIKKEGHFHAFNDAMKLLACHSIR